jgi:protein phosphatase
MREKMTENNFQIDSASISDRGLSEKRPQNEDSFLELNERGLFVVADGVGGAQAGDVASQMAVEVLGEAFANLPKNGDAEELMKIAIERANEAIFQTSHDLASLSTMATTIVALHVEGNIATIGHVGDSRLYRLDPKGDFFRETQDHSVVEEEVRAGRITREQAANHPSRNVISRALGAEHSVEVDMKTIMVEPNTMFLLCSDGITRHIDDYQLRELLLFKDTTDNICRRMKDICYERGAEDNLTAVIVKLKDAANGSYAGSIKKTFPEFEEATVAAARPPAGDKAVAEQMSVEEIPTQPLTMPTADEPQKLNQTNVILSPTVFEVREPSTIRAENSEESNGIRANQMTAYAAATTSRKMSGLLSSILFLILGGIVGASVYHLFYRNNRQSEPIPQITQMQSPNIELSSFETLRRNVDTDPNSFINRNANITQDAEGLYLLGRAYLLTEKYPEAKKSFEDARNKLGQASIVNSRVLNNDIALGLAIVDEAAAQNKFQSRINSNGSNANAQTDVNANVNFR